LGSSHIAAEVLRLQQRQGFRRQRQPPLGRHPIKQRSQGNVVPGETGCRRVTSIGSSQFSLLVWSGVLQGGGDCRMSRGFQPCSVDCAPEAESRRMPDGADSKIFRHAWHDAHLDSRMCKDLVTMKSQDKTLVRKLAIVLVIKLVVVTALWWGFVREQGMAVDGDAAAAQLLGPDHTKKKE
jgi:hypothetical protein